MFKRLLPLSILFSTTLSAQVVRDTLFYDQYDIVTTKEKAKHFIVLSPAEGELKNIESFRVGEKTPYTKGTGVIGDFNTILYKGAMSYLDKKGNPQTTFFYKEDGTLERATSINPFTQEKLEATYQDEVLYDGSLMQQVEGFVYHFEAKEGVFLRYDAINPANKLNKLAYIFDENNVNTKALYYDDKGKLVHEVTFIEYSPFQGTQVILDTKNFMITDIYSYNQGSIIGIQTFYTNGKLKSKYTADQEHFTEEVFDLNGKKLTTLTGTLEEDGTRVLENGQSITFGFGDTKDNILYSYTYENSIITKAIEYYEKPLKGVVKTITSYDPETEYPYKVEYFDAKNKLVSTVDYQDYQPYNGTSYDNNQITTYKDGVMTQVITFYADSNQVFENRDNTVATYFDLNGKEIGKITYKIDEYGTFIPYTGTTYGMYENKLTSVEKYDKGVSTYKGQYNTESQEGKLIFSEESYYTSGILDKKTSYFPNGKKQKEEQYNASMFFEEPISAIYYNAAGKEIGRFDFEEQTGTKVTYSLSGIIDNIATLKEGQLIYSKTLLPKEHDLYETTIKQNQTEESYYIQSEIDYNNVGNFYNEKGELISTVIYKDGLPTTGTTYISDGYTITETPYIDGVKDGVENIYYIYLSLKVATKKIFYTEGVKTKEEQYDLETLTHVTHYNGEVQDGLAISYDTDGNEVSRVEYREGLPYEGTEVNQAYDYTTTIQYKKGAKVKTTYTTPEDEILIGSVTYGDNNEEERKLYNPEGDLQYVIQVKNNQLDGAYHFYENGKEKYKATFKEGRLEQGSVAINELEQVDAAAAYAYDDNEQTTYSLYSYRKNTLTTSIIDIASGKIEFTSETKIKKGDKSQHPQLSKVIEINNLYPNHILNTDLSYYYY